MVRRKEEEGVLRVMKEDEYKQKDEVMEEEE